MQCPHCGTEFHPQRRTLEIELPSFVRNPGADYGHNVRSEHWWYNATACVKCRRPIVDFIHTENIGSGIREDDPIRVYPRSSSRAPTPNEIPADLKKDYEEACEVLSISAKASAALARRCMQTILRGQGYTQHNLVDQVNAVLKETDASKSMPSHLHDQIDAVRNFGNFGAHPITDVTTLQIIPVEAEEAEWCLEIVEGLFDHFYVKPAQVAARKAALNAKLASAGKKPAK